MAILTIKNEKLEIADHYLAQFAMIRLPNLFSAAITQYANGNTGLALEITDEFTKIIKIFRAFDDGSDNNSIILLGKMEHIVTSDNPVIEMKKFSLGKEDSEKLMDYIMRQDDDPNEKFDDGNVYV